MQTRSCNYTQQNCVQQLISFFVKLLFHHPPPTHPQASQQNPHKYWDRFSSSFGQYYTCVSGVPSSSQVTGNSVVTMMWSGPQELTVQHKAMQPQLPVQTLAHNRYLINITERMNVCKSGFLVPSPHVPILLLQCFFVCPSQGPSGPAYFLLLRSHHLKCPLYSPVVPNQINLNQTMLSWISLPVNDHFLHPDCKAHQI